jgi:hypothetical protein
MLRDGWEFVDQRVEDPVDWACTASVSGWS